MGTFHSDDPSADIFQIDSWMGRSNDRVIMRVTTFASDDIRVLLLDIRRLAASNKPHD